MSQIDGASLLSQYLPESAPCPAGHDSILETVKLPRAQTHGGIVLKEVLLPNVSRRKDIRFLWVSRTVKPGLGKFPLLHYNVMLYLDTRRTQQVCICDETSSSWTWMTVNNWETPDSLVSQYDVAGDYLFPWAHPRSNPPSWRGAIAGACHDGPLWGAMIFYWVANTYIYKTRYSLRLQ